MPEQSEWEKYKSNPEGYAKGLAEKASKPSRPWDFLDPRTEYVTKEEAASRLGICKACPRLIPGLLQCKECGCFMKAKTTIKHATCPIGKW